MRKLFSLLAVSLAGAMSFGAPVPAAPLVQVSGGKGKGHGKPARRAKKTGRPWASGKHYPFSSTRQSRPKHRTAVVHGFPILQRMNRQQIADLYRSSVL